MKMFLCMSVLFPSLIGFLDGKIVKDLDVTGLVGAISWGTRIAEKYLEFEGIGLYECAKECMRRKRCMSFNYCALMNYCELNYEKLSSATILSEQEDNDIFIHSDISTWNKIQIGRCQQNDCDLNSKCNLTSGECELSDCGPAVQLPNTDIILHGHHEVGNGIIYRCQKNYQMVDLNGNIVNDGIGSLMCNSSGEWEYPKFKCNYMYPDWLKHGRHYFKFSESAATWEDAVQSCNKILGKLVEIMDQDANDFLERQIQKHGYVRPNFWIGGNDRHIENKWIWQSSEQEFIYTNWNENEPNNLFNEDCVVIAENGKWNDLRCGDKQKYICQNQ